MAKTPGITLHRLIRSLNKIEIRHFRQRARRGKQPAEKSYLALFDLVLAQKEFDDDALFRASGVPRKATFNESKRYLFEAVLDALADLKRSTTPELRAQKLKEHAQALADHKLYEPALERLDKAQRLADTEGNPLLAFELFETHEQLLRDSLAVNQLLEVSAENAVKKKKLLGALTQRVELQQVYNDVTCLYNQFNPNATQQLIRTTASLRPAAGKKYPGYTELILWNSILEKKYEALGRREKAEAIQEKMIAYIPAFFPREKAYLDYSVWIHNLVANLLQLKKHRKASAIMQRMKDVGQAAPPKIRMRFLLLHYNTTFSLLLRENKFAAILALYPAYREEISPVLLQNDGIVNLWLYHSYVFALAFFMEGNFRTAIQLLFRIDNRRNWEIGHHLVLEVIALKALAHYERDDAENAQKLVTRYRKAGRKAGILPSSATYILISALEAVLRSGKTRAWKQAQEKIELAYGTNVPPRFFLAQWLNKKSLGHWALVPLPNAE